MLEQNPIQNDSRHARREQLLGREPRCARCDCAEFDALIPTKHRLLEKHHIAGRNHDPDLTLVLCRNCHAILTEQLRKNGADMREQPTLLERIVAILRAIGTALTFIGQALLRWAEELARFILDLDASDFAWREMGKNV